MERCCVNCIEKTAIPISGRNGDYLASQRRPADSLSVEVEIYLSMVGDLDERYALVHPVVIPRSLRLTLSLAGNW
jgi:hypothetical protein